MLVLKVEGNRSGEGLSLIGESRGSELAKYNDLVKVFEESMEGDTYPIKLDFGGVLTSSSFLRGFLRDILPTIMEEHETSGDTEFKFSKYLKVSDRGDYYIDRLGRILMEQKEEEV